MEPSEQRYSQVKLPRGERPIRLGSLLFTLVEPRPGYEVAYNRWYERDHFYSGCMIGAYTLAGNRFVATRDCKAKRFGSGDRPLEKGSYLALYWILDGHHQDWDDWAVTQVNRLHSEGRMFSERDHIHTGFYSFEGEYNGPGSTMPIELALDRAYAGLGAFIIDLAPGKTKGDVNQFLNSRGDLPGDVALLGAPVPLDPRSPSDVPVKQRNDVVLISFLIGDPVAEWDDRYVPLGRAIEDAGLGRVGFASPFVATVFGTDTYTDQL